MRLLRPRWFLVFAAESGADSVEILYANVKVWATQNMMAMIYGIDRSGNAKHLKNLFDNGELCCMYAVTTWWGNQ